MRFFYSALFCPAIPVVLARLYWRGFKAPAYRLRWQERLGFYPEQNIHIPVIWFHTVSVGEFEAALPLITRCLNQFSDSAVLITTTTPTASARVNRVFGSQVLHVYLPYDIPWVVSRFLRCFRPVLAIVLEKELWPNLFAACHRRSIPIVIVNARLSGRSAKSYQSIAALTRPALQCINTICAQTDDDRRRFIAIGAEAHKVLALGNIKFDMTVDQAMVNAGLHLKRTLFENRWVWILASTHDGEEEHLLRVATDLRPVITNLLVVIAPRHPERFNTVRLLCAAQGLKVAVRSQGDCVLPETDVYLADTMGELKMLYKAADVAFVGGSLVAVGGHNVIEAAMVEVPILFGPFMFNFQDIADQLLHRGGAIQAATQVELRHAMIQLHQDAVYRKQMVDNALNYVKDNQGAVERTMAVIAPYIQSQNRIGNI